MEQKKFYISDLHYGHQNVLSFDGRPFDSLDQMHSELIRRWNETVTNADHVYVLGDMFWCRNEEAVPVLKKLRGNIHLIQGNHDRVNLKEFKEQFAEITPFKELKDGDYNVTLCHYPIPFYKRSYDPRQIMLYGHVHATREHFIMNGLRTMLADTAAMDQNPGYAKGRFYNVGCMLPYMDYTPRTLEEILAANQ